MKRSVVRHAIIVCVAAASLVAGTARSKAQSAAVEFGSSLAFRPDRIVVDSAHTAFAWLAQTAPVAYRSTSALQLTLTLRRPDPSAVVVKELGTTRIFGGDLATHPFPVAIDLHGLADGDYEYLAVVRDGDATLASLGARVRLVARLDEQQAVIERRLANVAGHESAKASIRYPFDLARVINQGRRVFGSGNGNPEFGMNQQGDQVPYDFSAGMARSLALLRVLETGKDPVWRAGGEMVRHYYMPEAGEILPYHVFVPSTWDHSSALPLVFILHGNSRDQDYYFDRDGRIIPKTANRHGYMLVAPLGYSPNGGYNYVPYGRAAGPRGLAAAAAAPHTFGPPDPVNAQGRAAAAGFGGVNGSVTPADIRAEWSEQDAMHVFDLIKAEYPIDVRRTFLFGYSAGGQGAHYLGPKFAERWAAIAIGGSNAQPADVYPYARLRTIPMLIFCGASDTANLARSRTMTEALQEHGVSAVFREYPGATHDSAPSAATADIFAFFDAHARK